MPYRNMLVRMYYAVSPTTRTPTPFAEFRVFIITRTKQDWDKIFPTMEEILDLLEWLLGSIRTAREKDSIYYEYSIEGTEKNVLIDIDEAKSSLATTGVKKPKFGDFFRFVSIFKQGRLPRSYNEAEIRIIKPPPIKFTKWLTEVRFPEKE